jgi:peptidoglycan/LPS O-acetylase OafA/YrhL
MRQVESAADGAVAADGSTGHRADIDGLRALAVGGVILFHFGVGVPGGYAGVDVFFVISGFLISRILFRQAGNGHLALVHFFERRVRRVFPACAVTIVCTLVAGWFLLQPAELVSLARAAIAQAWLVSNFHFAKGAGYFDASMELQPLLHMWSLAVEEQFYLVFPFAIAAAQRGGTRALRRMSIAGLLLSLMIGAWMSMRWHDASFYWPFGRAWEFLAGTLLALPHAPYFRNPAARNVASLVGILAICTVFAIPAPATWRGIAAVAAACAGAVMIIEAGNERRDGIGSRVLSARPLVAIGVISYSLYLVHWPIAAFMRAIGSSTLDGAWPAVGIFLTLVLGTTSWALVERPFRRGLGAGSVPATAVMLATGVAAILALGTWFVDGKGLPGRPIARAGGSSSNRIPQEFGNVSTQDTRDGRLPRLGACGGTAPVFALWGDSHGLAISRTVAAAAQAHGLCGIAALRPAMVPLLATWRPASREEHRAWNDAAWEAIRRSGAQHVLLVARWSINVDGRENGDVDSLVTDEEAAIVDRSSARASMVRGFRRTLAAIREAGMDAWILLEPPQLVLTPSQCAARRLYGGVLPARCVDTDRFLATQATIQGVIAELGDMPGVHLVNLGRPCLDADPHESDFADRDHLSPEGADRMLGGIFDGLMESIARTSPRATRRTGGASP